MSNRMCIVLTTVANEDDAEMMTAMLLDRRLAACTQQVSVSSRFRWNGAVQAENELLLLVKTSADRVNDTVAAIRDTHKYDLPEIISIPVDGGLPAYLDWVVSETRPR